MFAYRHGLLAVCVWLCACGAGNTSSNNSTGQASYGRIALLSHVPADDAVQVALDGRVLLRFDSAMVLDCMHDEDTWLRAVGSSNDVPGAFTLLENGRTVAFVPDQPLQAETDYSFQVSPLTCDQAGRLLETTATFTFRTLDSTPPHVVTANVLPGETGRSRTAPLQVTMSEALAKSSVTPTTVVLRDAFNTRYPVTRTVAGDVLTVTPLADLPGDRQLTLQLAGSVTDRAGNPLGATWSVLFRTAADLTAPRVTSLWPSNGSTGLSPAIQPVVKFDESMDPGSVEPSSLLFEDEFGSLVAFSIEASPDQRTLRVKPLHALQGNRTYLLAFLVSTAAVTDVSGNGLVATQAMSFQTGSDALAPTVQSTTPADGATRVSIGAEPTITFDDALDPTTVTDDSVQLRRDGEAVDVVLTQPTAATIQLSPVLPLLPGATYELWLHGGQDGLRDVAGNPLAADTTTSFVVTDDASLPTAILQPADAANNVPVAARASIVFDSVLDPASVDADTVQLQTDTGTPLAATISLHNGDRVVAIVPSSPLSPNTWYRTVVRGGSTGVRELSGNWLPDHLQAHFRTGSTVDLTPPIVSATIDALESTRRAGIVVPPSGFTFDVSVTDGAQVPDMGSVEIELVGPATATTLPPTTTQLWVPATVGFRTFRTIVPANTPLAVGNWTATVRVRDLSGNVGEALPITFGVAAADAGTVPFERTQVVWPRTDMDRDGNGRPDFDDDLVRLGLETAGDPRGTNATVRRLVLDATLAAANRLYGRGDRGEPLDDDSVAVRFTTHQPIGIGHLQIALGGFDPEGTRNRGYGDASTGVLGRAFFDSRNADINDRNIGTSPGLGVFPSEMFLYQAEIHRQVYPSFQTMWAQRFLPLCPDIGGTPVGNAAVDAAVLAPTFDVANATTEQRARWTIIMRAIDDWAVVTGTVLAHEVGHAVGLVAPGPAPGGLFGDSSLHNAGAGSAEVMAPAVGYEAMITLGYHFRDINIAYLRQRILQR